MIHGGGGDQRAQGKGLSFAIQGNPPPPPPGPISEEPTVNMTGQHDFNRGSIIQSTEQQMLQLLFQYKWTI